MLIKRSVISSSLSFDSFQVAIFSSCIASTKVPSFSSKYGHLFLLYRVELVLLIHQNANLSRETLTFSDVTKNSLKHSIAPFVSKYTISKLKKAICSTNKETRTMYTMSLYLELLLQ